MVESEYMSSWLLATCDWHDSAKFYVVITKLFAFCKSIFNMAEMT